MIEKRKFPRFDKALEVVYSAKTADSEMQGYSVSSNVSKGGMCLPLAKHVKNGDTLKFKIRLAGRPDINAGGKVRWTKDIKRLAPLELFAGIEFTKITPRDSDSLINAAA